MKFFKIYLLILFQQFDWLFGKYNHLQLEGNIFNLETNLSVFIKNSSGMLFYAIDSDYKCLIETKATQKTQLVSLFYKHSNWNFTLESTHSCKRTIYGDVYLQFYIHLQQSKFYIGCNQTLSKLNFERNENTEYLKQFPSSNSNKIYIWIGNVGQFTGKGNRKYYPSKVQLLGCVDDLYLNKRKHGFSYNGSIFQSNCNIKYIKKIYGINFATKKEIFYKMYDCNIISLNGRYCINNIDFRDLSFGNSSHIEIPFRQTNFILRLDWKRSKPNIEYCLLEIVLRENSLIWFFVNKNNVLIERKSVMNSSNYEDVFSLNVLPNTNNILLIHNDKSTLTIKIYDGEIIHISKQSILSEMINVNIGHCKHAKFSHLSFGNFRLQYNKSSWKNSMYISKALTTTTTITKFKSINANQSHLLYLIVLITFTIVSLVIILVLVFLKNRRKSKTDKNLQQNRSKPPSPNHYEYDFIETNVDRNINVERNVNVEMQDNNEYDIIPEKLN